MHSLLNGLRNRDTVGSIGVFGGHLAFTRMNPSIVVLRHALALDERRTRYRPNPYVDKASRGGVRKGIPSVSERFNQEPLAAPAPSVPPPVINSGDRLIERRLIDCTFLPKDAADGQSQQRTDGRGEVVGAHQKTGHLQRKEVWFAGCHSGELIFQRYIHALLMCLVSDVGGGSVGSALGDGFNLANASLGWMVKQAVLADAGLLFRPDAFKSYSGVLEVVGPYIKTCGGAPLETQPEMVTRNLLEDLSKALGLGDLSGVAPGDQADEVYERLHRRSESEKRRTDDRVKEPFKTLPTVQDACSPVQDKLGAASLWWILEILPLWEKRVGYDGYISKGFR